jgi:hypothetical protein
MKSRIYSDTRRSIGVVLFAACAMSVSGRVLSAQQQVKVTRDKIARETVDVVAWDQLHAHPELSNAYTIVEALHSNWLIERNIAPPSGGVRSFVPEGARSVAGENAGVQVYLDGHRLGGVQLLRNIPATAVYSIRHLSGTAAQARFGGGHSYGVIYVATLPAWDRVR